MALPLSSIPPPSLIRNLLVCWTHNSTSAVSYSRADLHKVPFSYFNPYHSFLPETAHHTGQEGQSLNSVSWYSTSYAESLTTSINSPALVWTIAVLQTALKISGACHCLVCWMRLLDPIWIQAKRLPLGIQGTGWDGDFIMMPVIERSIENDNADAFRNLLLNISIVWQWEPGYQHFQNNVGICDLRLTTVYLCLQPSSIPTNLVAVPSLIAKSIPQCSQNWFEFLTTLQQFTARQDIVHHSH